MLVHEAWLRLAEASVEWRDRNHFLRVAATDRDSDGRIRDDAVTRLAGAYGDDAAGEIAAALV